MKSSARLLVPLGVVLLLVGAVYVCRGRPEATHREAAHQEAATWSISDEIRRGEWLKERHRVVLGRAREQQRISAELAAGRCTLLEAAREFLALYHGDPNLPRALRDAYPAGSDDERVCRWVIAYAQNTVEDGAAAAELAARLEAELQRHLQQGTLRLTE